MHERVVPLLILAQSLLEPSAALLGMALASIAILRARTCPWLIALACWAALALCVAMNLVPAGGSCLLGLAVLAAVAAQRLPAGLAWSLFAWLASLAAGWTLTHASGLGGSAVPEVICHTAAALAAWWMLAALLTRYWSDRWAADARAVFSMTAITMATAAMVLLTYSLATVAVWRVSPFGWYIRPVFVPVVAWQGLIDIALVATAVLLSGRLSRWSSRPVALLWLAIFAGSWYSLRVPVASELTYNPWPEWLTAGTIIQTTLTLGLLGAVIVWIVSDWRAQSRAWPSQLDSLVRISRPWPGLEATAVALGVALVPAGLWHAFSTGPGACQVARLTTWEIAGAALALSMFIAWHWNRSLAELALSLWTVSLAAFGATTAIQLAGRQSASIDELPAVQSGALAGLSVASFLWFWLSTFWRRQLRDGRAWTTAGRLVPYADRIGFLSASLAILVGARLALWPRVQYGSADNSLLRICVVSGIFLLLVVACLYAARRTRRPTLLWLAGMAGTVWGLFVWLRH